ncbi:PREDICTED: borealin-like isoform X2 [Nicrophorus vespilloides]|uniref:Borealin-like isoform X2 n=1 Tax=Nicrophorus vespilloides TaxID=110193 RepID=A0ABM1N5X5_NICVS|nr:PREDICTED: borealin-like isoform X2 [Nicrophorus vespilloides]
MPRTKVVKSSVNKNNEVILGMLDMHQKIFDNEKQQRESKIDQLIKELERNFQMIRLSIPFHTLNKTIAELRTETDGTATINSICENYSAETFFDATRSIQKGKKSKLVKRSRSSADDEAENSGSQSSAMSSRTSRSRAKVNNTATKRVSRSLSRNKNPSAIPLHKTPLKKNKPIESFGMVTPKVKPNTPQVILRRPKQGEVAISLQGSPLMVNNVMLDQMANVNIPLGDGRIITIQPHRGLRQSQIPEIDANTQRQLKALRDNLNKMCATSAVANSK